MDIVTDSNDPEPADSRDARRALSGWLRAGAAVERRAPC